MTSDIAESRASGLITRTFPVSVSRDSYCTCMCHGGLPRLSLCHAYVFSLMLLTHLQSWRLVLAGLRYAHTLPERFASRVFLRPVFYLTSLLSLHLPDWTIFLSSPFMLLTHLRLCRLVFLPDFVTPICYPDDSSVSSPSSSCAQFSTRRFDSCSLTRLDAILALYFYGSYACLYLYCTDLYIY